MTQIIQYESYEYDCLLEVFETIKCDKYIANIIESFIYEWIENQCNLVITTRYLTRFGEKHGELKEWWTDGQLICHCNYNNGQKEGEYKEWFTPEYGEPFPCGDGNGKLCRQCYYKDGKKEGEYKQWHEKNGKLHIQCDYNDGYEEGEYKEWHENGQLYIVCNYLKGKREGEYKMWNNEGNLIKEEFYINGEKIKVN